MSASPLTGVVSWDLRCRRQGMAGEGMAGDGGRGGIGVDMFMGGFWAPPVRTARGEHSVQLS